MIDALSLVAYAWGAVAALMFVLWIVHLAIRNAAVVDVGWTFGVPLASAVYAWRAETVGPRLGLLLAMTLVWGTRLGVYLLFTRVIGQPEEGRYRELRARWATGLTLKFFGFFQLQGAIDVLLSLPALLVALGPDRHLSAVEWAGFFVWALGMAGEVAADRQLDRFKSNPAHAGKVCMVGLWRFSRHPNYFFEWVVWVGYAVYALGAPFGWLALACPAAMLYFLLRVTGIPATEAHALKTRGEAYQRYQQTTSAFVPWFPRKMPVPRAGSGINGPMSES
jgi:steroid 5-alpha reductase family enzyme